MVIITYFYEQSDTDYEDYDKKWEENKRRFNFLDISHMVHKEPNDFGFIYSGNQGDDISSRDVLAIRFPHKQDKKRCDQIIENIIKGKGITIGGNIWYPKEVWVYV